MGGWVCPPGGARWRVGGGGGWVPIREMRGIEGRYQALTGSRHPQLPGTAGTGHRASLCHSSAGAGHGVGTGDPRGCGTGTRSPKPWWWGCSGMGVAGTGGMRDMGWAEGTRHGQKVPRPTAVGLRGWGVKMAETRGDTGTRGRYGMGTTDMGRAEGTRQGQQVPRPWQRGCMDMG